MKNIVYTFLSFFVLFQISCSADHQYKELKWIAPNDTLEFKMYHGSDTGAIEINLSEIRESDKTRFEKIFENKYKYELYKNMRVEFLGDKMSYIDSIYNTKIISDYEFKENSLYVIQTNGKHIFVGLGTFDELYRLNGICIFKKSDEKDYKIEEKNDIYIFNEVLVKAGYTDSQTMKNLKDTLAWFNVRYNFR